LLEKDRRFRYQSSADLRSDLERLKRELSDTGFKAAAVAEKKSIVMLPFSTSPQPATTRILRTA
jgi:hypothetical protein